jgi:hypothetical protein
MTKTATIDEAIRQVDVSIACLRATKALLRAGKAQAQAIEMEMTPTDNDVCQALKHLGCTADATTKPYSV